MKVYLSRTEYDVFISNARRINHQHTDIKCLTLTKLCSGFSALIKVDHSLCNSVFLGALINHVAICKASGSLYYGFCSLYKMRWGMMQLNPSLLHPAHVSAPALESWSHDQVWAVVIIWHTALIFANQAGFISSDGLLLRAQHEFFW